MLFLFNARKHTREITSRYNEIREWKASHIISSKERIVMLERELKEWAVKCANMYGDGWEYRVYSRERVEIEGWPFKCETREGKR